MAGRIGGEKNRNSGQWTEARFKSFIRSALRGATRRWGPIQEVKKAARRDRGIYECNVCKEHVPLKVDRKNNVHVDHIHPAVDPSKGFVSWDSLIERMFCEEEGLQVLCTECHDAKTNLEKAEAKERREREKNK